MLDHLAIEPESSAADTQGDVLLAQLRQLKSQTNHGYEPARLRFIESLLTRSKNENDRVRQLLEDKAQQAFKAYQTALTAEKSKAENLLLKIEKKWPERMEQAQKYFDQGDFDALKQFSQRLFNQQGLRRSRTDLVALTEALLTGSEPQEQSGENQLNELLLQQETKALLSLEHDTDPCSSLTAPKQKPLKANLRYQQLQQKQQLNHFMASLMAAKPSNPGPLNPERLAIELLREMHSLSPGYFNHCLANIETLLWLEKQQKAVNKK